MKNTQSEKDLAAHVVAWLHDHQWEVYQEVPVAGGVADIVAVQGPVRWIIETKLSMSIQLLAQLDKRVGYAHMVSAAIPARVRREAPYRLLKALGVGLLTVSGGYIDERLRPVFLRKALDIELHEEQKTFCEAGSAGGGHWTPFKQTARAVVAHVCANPGCTLKEMLPRIQHHYGSTASANHCIVMWIQQKVIKGIRIDRSGNAIKLYPEEEVA